MSGWAVHWARPELVWVLVVWALVAAVVLLLERRGSGALDRLVSVGLQSTLVARPARWRRGTRLSLLMVSGGAMALALLQPQMGERFVATPRVGAEIMIALDVSRSMLADDAALFRELGSIFLERTGRVVTANNGYEAIAVFRRERPSVVVADLDADGGRLVFDGLLQCVGRRLGGAAQLTRRRPETGGLPLEPLVGMPVEPVDRGLVHDGCGRVGLTRADAARELAADAAPDLVQELLVRRTDELLGVEHPGPDRLLDDPLVEGGRCSHAMMPIDVAEHLVLREEERLERGNRLLVHTDLVALGLGVLEKLQSL